MSKLKVIDLFAGCGGLSEGFEQSDLFKVIAHVEWESSACKTLIRRLKKKWQYIDAERRVLHFDIQRTNELINGWKDDPIYGSNFGLSKLVREAQGIDLLIGGPPCQAYSIAGRVRDEHGMNFDYRNYLFESYLEVVKKFKPMAVVFENVPGMLSAQPGGTSIIDRISDAFRQAGYLLADNLHSNTLIDFTHFGIPQNRKRVILVGLKRSLLKKQCKSLHSKFYREILPKYHTSKPCTVHEAIGNLPPFYPAKVDFRGNGRMYSHEPCKTDFLNHSPRYHNRRDINIFRDLAYDLQSGKRQFISADSLKELYTKRTGKVSSVHKYYVLRRNEPSNTIPAHLYKDGLRHIHPDPDQARSITVREAARLQTFDDDYEFLGSIGDQYKMIGNAVPPVFSKKLANAIYELLKKYSAN